MRVEVLDPGPGFAPRPRPAGSDRGWGLHFTERAGGALGGRLEVARVCGSNCLAIADLSRYRDRPPMRPRRSPSLLAVLIPIALVLGIWLGGHPGTLPGFARDALVADSDGRLYEEAVDTIERDYYRKVDRKALLNKSLGGRGRVAAGPVLALLLAEGLHELPARHRGPVRGRRACPCARSSRACASKRSTRPAGQGRAA